MGKATGKYIGQSRWAKLDENGSLTGEVKLVDEFDAGLDTRRNGFMITYMGAVISLIEKLGTKKMTVVKYILENMSKSENTLIITTKELAEKTQVSKPVVLETLKMLEEAGARMEETEGMVAKLRSVKGIQIAMLIKENDIGEMKVAMRAKEEGNVAKIAGKYGGGGHIKAAGCTINDSMENVRALMIKEVSKQFGY